MANTNPPTLIEFEDRFIRAHEQPAILIDLARNRGIDTHRLLKGTHIFYDDILKGDLFISLKQFHQLIENSQKLIHSQDLSFLFGHRMLPGNYGAFSSVLGNASNLHQALILTEQFSLRLTPLIRPRILLDDKYCYLHWVGSFQNASQHRFIIESTFSAITSATQWLSDTRLPWRYYFSYEKPKYSEQYDVHFSTQVKFNTHLDMLCIERDYLTQAWPKASETAYQLAFDQAKQQTEAIGVERGFIDYLYRYLWEQIDQSPSLETVAEHLCTSPATLKRRLKAHHISFQQLIDMARKHMSLYLFHMKGFSNEQVASYLKFHDVNNFRRSFKRWTGMTPSSFRSS